MRRILALVLALALLAGCGGNKGKEAPPVPEQTPERDLAARVTARPVMGAEVTEEAALAAVKFGLDLFRESLDGENTLVSPLSVLEALAMTANGAAGDTLAQMESVFGLDRNDLNGFLLAYRQGLGKGTNVANGIWLNDELGLNVKEGFLQANADYYGAGVTQGAFDEAARDEINAFVRDHTAGRIERILEELDPSAAMVLVNALSFDGTWETIYREDQIQAGTFTSAAGEEQDAAFMWSDGENYIADSHAEGFVKYYEGRDYAFAALLPEEGMTLADYAATLTAEGLRAMLENEAAESAGAALPKFTASWGAELSPSLAAMGMPDLFDPEKADLSAIAADDALHVSQVQHKTFINVDEKGTQAGAATAVGVKAASLMGPEKQVVLDRPFLYMLIDCEHNVPLFIGAVTEIG